MMPDHARPQRARGDILFIASAYPEYVRVALRGLREAYPRASFDAIARQEALAATTAVDGCNVIYVTGTAQGRVELVRRLRNATYPTVAFIEAGSGGYVALQMLPLVLGIRNIILLDEDGVAISIRPGKAALIARHAKLRLKHKWKAVLYSVGLTMLRTLLSPIGLIVLLIRTGVVLTRQRPVPSPWDTTEITVPISRSLPPPQARR